MKISINNPEGYYKDLSMDYFTEIIKKSLEMEKKLVIKIVFYIQR
jgi:hypothetical protein